MALWILGLVLMFVTGKVLSMVTLASIERDDPNQAVSRLPRLLRVVYRRIVTMAGVYWYISLPFVAVIIVAITAAVIYAFLALGRIPVKLALILLLGAAVSLYAIVRSLLVRIRDDEDPGRAVSEAEAPGLWKTAHEVAAAVGTRSIDEIWLTPGTDLAVFERGTVRQRMTDRARRALLLGAGVLEGFQHGATRLQEVLADRVAIQHYGMEAFRNGLTHVIRRPLLFQKLADEEIQEAIRQQRLLSNLYSLSAPSDPTTVNSLEEQVTKTLQAKTTEDDTHPSFKDRLRLGERIHSATVDQGDGYVWQLFRDPPALMAEMTSLVAQRVSANVASQAAL